MPVQGLRTTATSITTENRLVRMPDEKLLALEPNATPLLSFMIGLKQKKSMETPRIEHHEDDYLTQWVTTSAQTNANAASTTITLVDGSSIVVGDTLLVYSGSSSNHEMVRVTAKGSADVCTVVRNIGSTGLLTITSGAGLLRMGTAHEEGSASPVARITTPSLVTNYMQIFKRSVNITGTDAASRKYSDDGNERKRLRQKMLKEFKIDKNQAYLWGKPSESLTGGPNSYPIRTTGGIDHFITTNRYDVGGLLTKKGLTTFSRMAFRYHNKALLLASPPVISAISEWGNSFMRLEPAGKVYGVDITKVITPHGVWMLVNDWTLRDGVTGQNGSNGYAFSLDMNFIEERYLEGRDTRVKLDAQPNDEDRNLDYVMCESGLLVRHEKRHARLYGATDYSA